MTGEASQTRALAAEVVGKYVRRIEELGIGAAEGLAIVRREIEARVPAGPW